MFSDRQVKANTPSKSKENRQQYAANKDNFKPDLNPNLLPGTILNPESLRSEEILQLQKSIGNQAVLQLLNIHNKKGTGAQEENPQEQEKLTGIPDKLKSGLEAMSGLNLSDVRVHHNSDKPLQVGALAYTQGSDIFIGPGQEKHLPHEGWHVVQQKKGQVATSTRVNGLPVNDEKHLEKEAVQMGAKAWQSGSGISNDKLHDRKDISQNASAITPHLPLQRVIVAPNKADFNTIIGIYRMLRKQKDQKVTRYKLLRKQQADLSNESQILFKGHGSSSGEYGAGGKDGSQGPDQIAQVLSGAGGQNAKMIGLDYCHSANIAKALKQKMGGTFTGLVQGNKNVSVTQKDGENYSIDSLKNDPQKQTAYNSIINSLKTQYSTEHAYAQSKSVKLNAKLKGETDPQRITELYKKYGKKIYKKLKPVYANLYQHNAGIIDPYGKEIY